MKPDVLLPNDITQHNMHVFSYVCAQAEVCDLKYRNKMSKKQKLILDFWLSCETYMCTNDEMWWLCFEDSTGFL